ncbi:putative nuclease HARBI1 isoform X3 [Bombyx mori]
MLLSVADFIGVSKASACRTVRDVSNAIAQLYSKYIYMHSDTEQDFYAVSRFPRVLGALDGTHIRIQSPCSQIGEEFRNRKGYFSLNVQAVCNADLLFMNVVTRWPGSAHDATIFNNSDLRAQCENGSFGNKWLLGDSAYPLKPYLLTPLINTQTRGEQLYNEAHIRTRNCIERCFGVWKRRFPVVALTLRLSLLRANAVIIATAVLHNICRLKKLDDISPEVEIPEADVSPTESSTEETFSTERANLIAEYFHNL